MRTLVTTMLISALLLTACGRDSRMNPRNWFGSSKIERRATPADGKENNPLIPAARDSIFRRKADGEVYKGTPIHAIADVTIEPSAGGAIIKATGVALRQGAFDVRLRPLNDGEPVDGVLSFTMDALQPVDRPQGPIQTRTVNAGRFISTQTLDSVKAIRVIAASNTHVATRR